MPKLFRFAPIGALLSLLLLVTAHSSSAATYTVTNTNSSGDGSLRRAILDGLLRAGQRVYRWQNTKPWPEPGEGA